MSIGGEDLTVESFRRTLRAHERAKPDQRSNIWVEGRSRRTQLVDMDFHPSLPPEGRGEGGEEGGLLRHLWRASPCRLDRNRY